MLLFKRNQPFYKLVIRREREKRGKIEKDCIVILVKRNKQAQNFTVFTLQRIAHLP